MKETLRLWAKVGVACAVAGALAGCGEDRPGSRSAGPGATSSSSASGTNAPPPADRNSAVTGSPSGSTSVRSSSGESASSGATGKGGSAGASGSGEALARQSTCLNCHAVDAKKVGPSLKDVAKKYKGSSADKLVTEMKTKPVHQAAIKATKEQDLQAIGRWILSL